MTGPIVEQGDGLGIKGDHPLGAELADRDAQPGAVITEVDDAVELEDDVFCGPSMVFTNVINPRSHVPRKDEYQRTRVKRGASIGANATIVCGVTLGEYSFIGAGSVVTDDVAPYALVVGVPGKRIGWICECGERLPDSGNGGCRACGKQYESHGATIERVSSG